MDDNKYATELESQVALSKDSNNTSTGNIEFKDSNKIEPGLAYVLEQAAESGHITAQEWPDPLPLTKSGEATPYPVESLPLRIKLAVQQVADFVQCPISLVASSAHSALSLAVQGLINVRRTENLVGPVSLFLLAIADSGERKTTCDNYFSQHIRAWENKQVEIFREAINTFNSANIAWEAKIEAIKHDLKKSRRSKTSSEPIEQELQILVSERPKPPLVPKILYVDATPEALAWSLSRGWHSAAMLSSEAGSIFGSHGMSRESVMSNLSLFNVLWDGGSKPIDRRTSESFIVQGARLTMGLSVQLETLQAFMDASKGLVRNIGFAARLLISWPKSTQGKRLFKESTSFHEHLQAFNTRIEELLNTRININERGEIIPEIVDLSPEAKLIWIKFHNDIESQLGDGGDLAETKDVASKAADNAVRLAALFHVFEYGVTSIINADLMQRAADIVAWHLLEAKRLFGVTGLPQGITNAIKLGNWLVGYCNTNKVIKVSKRDIQRLGPIATRNIKKLQGALDILAETHHVRITNDRKHNHIFINKKLLDVDDLLK